MNSIINTALKDTNLEKKIDLYNTIIEFYNNFERRFNIQVLDQGGKFNTPVNFKQAKIIPRHKWYTYKEGFSPIFVRDFIERFKINDFPVVFDPFGGIGTTTLESSILGLNSYSNDINPLSNYISKVKSSVYSKTDIRNIKLLKNELQDIQLTHCALPPENPTVLKYFLPETLEVILKIKFWIDEIDKKKSRDLFNLGLLTLLENFSTHKKDGNGVKRKKKIEVLNLEEIKMMLIKKVESFLEDINQVQISKEPVINSVSSFAKYKLDQKADLVITSPPYANCFDYSKVYLIELWFGDFFKSSIDQKKFRESSIKSHVHYTWKRLDEYTGSPLVNGEINNYLSLRKLWNSKIPVMLSGYFSDMEKVLREMSKNLNNDSTIGIVVGNSVYAGLPIATDILISEIAMRLGYEFVSIEVYRNLSASSQQLKIIQDSSKKFLRESLIILKWRK